MEMTYFEAISHFHLLTTRIDSLFQFWMSGTFALIVACHTAAERLTKSYAVVLAALYSAFVVSILLRLHLSTQLLAEAGKVVGKMRGTWVEGSSSFLAGGIHTSIWLTSEIGTVAAFFFLWHSYKENNLNIGVEHE
jgi:hypothetical protein